MLKRILHMMKPIRTEQQRPPFAPFFSEFLLSIFIYCFVLELVGEIKIDPSGLTVMYLGALTLNLV